MKSYYEILEVLPNATSEEIKTSYKRLALKYHPDRATYSSISSDEANAKFKELNEAYETLRSQDLRLPYDLKLKESYKSIKKQLFEKLEYGAPRVNLNEVLQLISQLDDKDIHATDHQGRNLLSLTVAASFKNEEEYIAVSQALVKKGVPVNPSSGFPPLHYAAIQGSDRAIQFLIKNGADVNAKDVWNSITPLHYATRCRSGGASSVIFHLIISGADVNARNRDGEAAREDIKVEDMIKKIEGMKASNRANLPSLKLFAARTIITHNLNPRDKLPEDCKNILNNYENNREYRRFIGIGK